MARITSNALSENTDDLGSINNVDSCDRHITADEET